MGSTQRRPQIQNELSTSNPSMTTVLDMESGVFPVFLTRKLSYTLYAVGKAVEDDPDVGISSVNRHDVASQAYCGYTMRT
jgi:hypothetical protein